MHTYLAKKRYQVMLTERKHIYVPHNHHLVVVLVKYGIVQDVCGVGWGGKQIIEQIKPHHNNEYKLENQ